MKTIPFTDKNGKTIQIPSHWTLKDLVKAGFTDIGIVKPEKPMKEGEFRSAEAKGAK